ncbi:MAG TPA: serine/threonine-protein kinase [Pseudonocardiaceae bacterium]|nr:serine/threonine-protein kinase [Pseudonocardiaceae bacterium]
MGPAASNKPKASPGSGRLPERFGPYRLESLIGQGAMGQVYRAVDTARDRVVAIKLLPAALAATPEFRDRFRRESALTARLREPHIVPIHDYGEIDGRLYIDMRLVEGANLSQLIARDGPFSPERAVNIVAQIASALDAAHAAGLVHRDIKPSNILVTDDRNGAAGEFVYVADFGLARMVADHGASLTMTGATVGSPGYMAPERFTGGHGDHRVDIYALGCLLFETLAAHGPFVAEGLPAMIHAHLNQHPPRLSRERPGLPAELDSVIFRAMAKNPVDRYATAGELAAAARAALALPGAVPPGAARPAGDEPARQAASFSQRETVIEDLHIPSPRPAPPDSAAPGNTRPARSKKPFLIAVPLFVIVACLIAIRPWASSPNSFPPPRPSSPVSEPGPTLLPDPALTLRQQANADRAALAEIPDGMWVPQISSKWVGLYADGIKYDNAAILANHQRWRAGFPASKLLWSGDWRTFDSAHDYWVTVAAIAFGTPDDANQWCDARSLPPNDCFARRLSTSNLYSYSQNTKPR